MILFRKFVTKIFKLYWHSFISVHIVIILVSAIVYCIYRSNSDSLTIENNYIALLNGMGVLTSFFILVIDKINLQALNEFYRSRENVPFAKREITQGAKAINLVFSMTFSMFLLLGSQYILLFFDIKILQLLILLVLYVFGGFIVVLGIWHGLELKSKP